MQTEDWKAPFALGLSFLHEILLLSNKEIWTPLRQGELPCFTNGLVQLRTPKPISLQMPCQLTITI